MIGSIFLFAFHLGSLNQAKLGLKHLNLSERFASVVALILFAEKN